jgi:hypothetical protein
MYDTVLLLRPHIHQTSQGIPRLIRNNQSTLN